MNVNVPIVELLTCLWNCSTEHGGYIWFGYKLETLKSEMEKLQRLKNHVQRRVETAERENELLDKVEYWLSNAGAIENDLIHLANIGSQELENTCLGSCCPKNCWSRHKIGKKIDTKLRNVEALMDEGAQHLNTPVERTLDRLKSCIEKEEVRCIGIYGKGGVGKTTVLNDISNELLNSECNFDFVIWVVVSQDPDVEKIQGDVAKEMGFLENRWKDKSSQERAREIFGVLSHKKFILLLDDIWKPVDLTQVGVPTPNRENGSKLLFTTRSEEVCNQMEAEEKVEVLRLTEKRAWELFREKVREDALHMHPEIAQLAETIAKMCNGVPLALITVGRAMTCRKTLQEWHYAIEVLRKSVSEISGTKDPVFALIKFSYDSLPNDTVKSCFLYCTLFPEDFSINKLNLIDYWTGEGFLGGEYNAASSVRNEGQKIISTLVHACLLEEEGEYVKMHDLIREVALWIASDCGKLKDKYLVEAGAQLSEAPEVGKWERVRRMSLMGNHIQNLKITPRCNDLLTLLLGNNHLKMIRNDFFQFMSSLKVVDLSENRELTELPTGISKIDSLQYLNLSKTSIRQLPVELKKLVKLKCLNLEYTYELQTIPVQVISGFSNLHVLRMLHCASSDRVVGDGIHTGGPESLLWDLQNLKHLNVLTITIGGKYSLQVFLSFNKFQSCTQALSLHHFKHSISLDISFLEGMQCLNDLEFIDCINLKELRVENSLIIREGCFNSLRKVSIVNCSKLEDLTWVKLAPNLEFLVVTRCSNMKEIIRQEKIGEGYVSTLAKLEVLRLVSLPNLKSIYQIALPLQYLKEIIVDECPKLKKLPLNSDSAKEHRIVIQGWEDWWENLEWEDEATQRIFLPSFKACMY